MTRKVNEKESYMKSFHNTLSRYFIKIFFKDVSLINEQNRDRLVGYTCVTIIALNLTIWLKSDRTSWIINYTFKYWRKKIDKGYFYLNWSIFKVANKWILFLLFQDFLILLHKIFLKNITKLYQAYQKLAQRVWAVGINACFFHLNGVFCSRPMINFLVHFPWCLPIRGQPFI